ncbi:hypothetical protein AA313_de0206456 [Arthrobotrys entomopaga]|nr:hypothetical protein AA313_de0206456 [Arthrobotrys entomopaga]
MKLLALPQELLLDIFSRLDIDDLARSKRVSKQLKQTVECVPLTSYTFHIDHTNQSAWKFMRHLIQNPRVGRDLRHLRVEWHRRIASDESTWTRPWKWSPEDRTLLDSIQEETVNSGVFGNGIWEVIRDGINSEALLPLLLYYSEYLETLDLGDVQIHLIICEVDMHRYLHEAIIELFQDEEPEDPYFHQNDPYGSFPMAHQVPPSPHSALWVQYYFQTEDGEGYLPGFVNLKYLRHGINDDIRCTKYTWGWHAEFLPPLLFLPKLEELEVNGCSTQGMADTTLQQDLEPFEGQKSNIKRLIMHDGRMLDEDYILVASVTGNIEFVSIEINPDKMPPVFIAYDPREIVNGFLEYNERLELENVMVDGETGVEVRAHVVHEKSGEESTS